MNYLRVIPRDLFNEASLLKCLGRFWIETERYQPRKAMIEHDGEPFDVQQDEDDGTLSVSNIVITIHGTRYHACRPLNSRQPWPLYLRSGDEEIAAFTDDGGLSPELLGLICTVEKEGRKGGRMNLYRDLPEGVTPRDCEKPNPRCDDCGAEVSGGDEPCQSCVERYEDAENVADAAESLRTRPTEDELRQKHMAQTMDFVNRALGVPLFPEAMPARCSREIMEAAIREALEWLDQNAPGKAREALRKGLGL